jgi:hypothetical protein
MSKTPPIPPQPPRPETTADTAEPKIAPLSGSTTIDAALTFEVEALSHVAMSKITRRFADEVAGVAQSTDRLIVLNDELARALEYDQAFTVQLQVLELSFESAARAADEGLQRLKGEAEGAVDVAAAVPMVGITAATGVVSAALNFLALFRQDTSYSGRKVKISEHAIIAELARHLRDKSISLYWPGLSLSPDEVTSEASESSAGLATPPYMTRLQKTMEVRDRAAGKIHALADALERAPDEKKSAARLALDRAHESFDSADSILRRMMTSLAQPDTKTGIAPVQLLHRANNIKKYAARKKGRVLYVVVHLESAGGSYRIRKNLFRTLFWSDGLTFSGGAILTYALLDEDGKVLLSRNASQREAFTSFEELSDDLEHRGRPWER